MLKILLSASSSPGFLDALNQVLVNVQALIVSHPLYQAYESFEV